MADDKQPKPSSTSSTSSSIPPPLDPFPTYQTPYPRSANDRENPFIQFRRFADEQFSNFFHGVPTLFGGTPPPHETWKRDVEALMKQRHEMEEGWRKQMEQEIEEWRQAEKARSDAWKASERAWRTSMPTIERAPESTDSWETRETGQTSRGVNEVEKSADKTPWWTKGRAAKCPALKDQGSQTDGSKCPALYNDAGQPKTELDAYDFYLQQSKADEPSAPAKAEHRPKRSSWWSSLGHDGKQMAKVSSSAADAATSQSQSQSQGSEDKDGTPRPSTYTFFAARRLSPFDNSHHTIPWLLLSPYSPIHLCNPSQPRLFKVSIQDAENQPLQISNARFWNRWYTDVDEKLAKRVPWADAFEDLVSLQQTGKMVERNYSTYRTPQTWIHDMVHRGSLGDTWGFNDQGLLVKRVAAVNGAMDTSAMKRGCRWRKERSTNSPKPQQEHENSLLESEIVDRTVEELGKFPLFGTVLGAADAIVSAVDRTAREVEDVIRSVERDAGSAEKPDQKSQDDDEWPMPGELLPASQPSDAAASEPDSPSSSSYYSSSSSSTSSSWSSTSTDDPKSVTSTLTSTTTRTLPDGSVETKRVLKKRFADGTEESDESVEVTNPARSYVQHRTAPEKETETRVHGPVMQAIEAQARDQQKQQQMETPRDEQSGRRRGGGGWFWT